MKFISALLLALSISACDGSIPDETPQDVDAGTVIVTPANQDTGPAYHDLPADALVNQPAPPAPDGGVTVKTYKLPDGGTITIPFGPAPADTSNCKCGVGCVMTLAYDGKGYYCEYVCMACP